METSIYLSFDLEEEGVKMETSMYDRQKSLGLKIPHSVAVVGVGGVGSWVAFNLALTGVPELILIDPDRVELSNLNRTPFKSVDVGTPKVAAMASLIYERRLNNCNLSLSQNRIEDCDLSLWQEPEIVVDCRDVVSPLPRGWQEKVPIVGGYDGFSITLHVNPRPESIWGDGPTTYTVTPSWLVPPQFIAVLITGYICSGIVENKKEISLTVDFREFLKNLLGMEQRR